MSAAASRTSSGGRALALQRAQRPLDDHQRVAHLVRHHGREPAQRREPLAQRGLALEAGDRVGERAEAARHQPRVLVVPRPAGPDAPRQVAGRGDLLHRVGERGERARHRARDRPAQQQAHRDRRERPPPRARRAACAAAAAPRRASAARARGARPARGRARRARARSPRRRGRGSRRVASATASAASSTRGSVEAKTRPCLHHRHVAAGERVEPRRERVVEREAERQVPEQLGRPLAEQDRHRDRLEQPAAVDVERDRPARRRPRGRRRRRATRACARRGRSPRTRPSARAAR